MCFSSGTLVRGPTTIIGKSPVNLAAQANQRKLSDPGGGTFRWSIHSLAGISFAQMRFFTQRGVGQINYMKMQNTGLRERRIRTFQFARDANLQQLQQVRDMTSILHSLDWFMPV